MRLSKQTTDAVKVLVHLARHADTTMSVPELAKACGMTEPVTFKLVPLLVREGFARTDRGRSGGVTLKRSPDTISLGEVVRALEKAPLEAKSSKGLQAPDLTSIVDHAFGGFLEILDQHSVADLAKKQGAEGAAGGQLLSSPVC